MMVTENAYAKQKQAGFTLVELLIVIVVIAIIAAISVIAYRGVQDRAYAAKVSAIVDTYAKIFELYKIDHGSYPLNLPYGDNGFVCLGSAADYPASGIYEEGSCIYEEMWLGGTSMVQQKKVDDDFNAALEPYVSSLPDGSLPEATIVNFPWSLRHETRGVTYGRWSDTIPGADRRPFLRYFLKGEQECSRGITQHLTVFEDGGGHGLTPVTDPDDPVDATLCEVYLGEEE